MRLTGAIHIGPLHHLPEWQRLWGGDSPPACPSAQGLLRVCPHVRQMGGESNERMSLRSKQIVKRKKKKWGGESQSWWEYRFAVLLGERCWLQLGEKQREQLSLGRNPISLSFLAS